MNDREYAEILNSYTAAQVSYRKKVMWLKRALAYQKMFRIMEVWDDDKEIYEWLKSDSQREFKASFYEVKRARTTLDALSKKLMDASAKRRTND